MSVLRVTLAPDYLTVSYLTRLATFEARVPDWLAELGPGYATQGAPIFNSGKDAAIIYVVPANPVDPSHFASLKTLWSQHGNGVQVTDIATVDGPNVTRDAAVLAANNPNPIAKVLSGVESALGIGAGVVVLIVAVVIILSLKPWTWRTTR